MNKPRIRMPVRKNSRGVVVNLVKRPPLGRIREDRREHNGLGPGGSE
jgi:hypothetical protein